jgi:hypothetical protein
MIGRMSRIGVEFRRRALRDKHGWIVLGLGTFFSLLIGCGLMALMSFSSRSGHDDAADPFTERREPPPHEALEPQGTWQSV